MQIVEKVVSETVDRADYQKTRQQMCKCGGRVSEKTFSDVGVGERVTGECFIWQGVLDSP